MEELFQTPVVQNLKDGKLPEMEVTIKTESIINLTIGVAIAAIIILIVYKVIIK